MKINSITNSNINHFQDVNKRQEGKQPGIGVGGVQPTDKLQISDKARKLQTNKVEPKSFLLINKKINSGFYNSKGVVNKVAESILKELS